jgi:hypothetical protein
MVRTAVNWGIVLLIALAATVLPAGGPTLNVIMSALTIAFFTLIAIGGYRLYMSNRFTIESLSDRQRFILYASIGVAFLNFTATPRLFAAGGLGVLVWLLLLAMCSFGVMWVYVSYRRYD